MPFIYMAKGISFSNDTLFERSIRIKRNKFILYYAVFIVIIIGTLAPIILATFSEFLLNSSNDSIFSYHLINFFTIRPCFERWNIVRLINACITLIMFGLATLTIKCINWNIKFENFTIGKIIDFWLRSFNMLRSIGSVYVIICGLFLFLSKIEIWKWIFSIDWIFSRDRG